MHSIVKLYFIFKEKHRQIAAELTNLENYLSYLCVINANNT